MKKDNKWVFKTQKVDQDKKKIIFFNHAAGTVALYQDWLADIPKEWEGCLIQYPMRANRMDEKMPDSIEQLAREFIEDNSNLFEQPFILFGHSMGAQVAYEVAFQLEKRGITPRLLCLSACESPMENKDEIVAQASARQVDETKLIEILKSYDHMVDETILEDVEFLDYYIPIVRADFAISDEYHKKPTRPLNCDIVVFTGEADQHVDKEKCFSWGKYTTGKTSFYEMEGDHFYLQREINKEKIISYILGGDSNRQ